MSLLLDQTNSTKGSVAFVHTRCLLGNLQKTGRKVVVFLPVIVFSCPLHNIEKHWEDAGPDQLHNIWTEGLHAIKAVIDRRKINTFPKMGPQSTFRGHNWEHDFHFHSCSLSKYFLEFVVVNLVNFSSRRCEMTPQIKIFINSCVLTAELHFTITVVQIFCSYIYVYFEVCRYQMCDALLTFDIFYSTVLSSLWCSAVVRNGFWEGSFHGQLPLSFRI